MPDEVSYGDSFGIPPFRVPDYSESSLPTIFVGSGDSISGETPLYVSVILVKPDATSHVSKGRNPVYQVFTGFDQEETIRRAILKLQSWTDAHRFIIMTGMLDGVVDVLPGYSVRSLTDPKDSTEPEGSTK